jgi:hypothetical protein
MLSSQTTPFAIVHGNKVHRYREHKNNVFISFHESACTDDREIFNDPRFRIADVQFRRMSLIIKKRVILHTNRKSRCSDYSCFHFRADPISQSLDGDPLH